MNSKNQTSERQHMFRAFSSQVGLWYYSDDEAYVLKDIDGKLFLMEMDNFYHEKDDIELCIIGEAIQSTGKTDTKGNHIFEGDIVNAPDAHDRGDGTSDEGIGLVCYDSSTMIWTIRFDDNYDQYMAEWCYEIKSELTVVGNMRENPELMEGSFK